MSSRVSSTNGFIGDRAKALTRSYVVAKTQNMTAFSVAIEARRSLENRDGVAGATACRQDWLVTYLDRIVRDPAICAGQPVIRGTRVLVRVVLGYLAHGETTEHILREFPSLAEEDVRAVIAFAAASAGEDLPAPSPIPANTQVA